MIKINKVVVGYVRTSGESNPKTSIPNQIDVINEYCNKNSLIIKYIFKDIKKSGMYTEGREDYQKLKDLIKNKKIDAVVVPYSDRLSRDSFEFISILTEMNKNGIEFISVSEDLSGNEMSPLQMAIIAVKAEIENKLRTDRAIQGKNKAVLTGIYTNSRCPFGYKIENKRLVVDQNEVNFVRQIFKEFKETPNFGAVASKMNLLGYRTKFGNKWKSGTIRSLLTNKTYTGKMYSANRVKTNKGKQKTIYIEQQLLSEVEHEAIVSEEYFNDINELIKKHYAKENKQDYHNFYLKGILKCPTCLGDMSGSFKENQITYRCKRSHPATKGPKSINANEVEKLFKRYCLETNSKYKPRENVGVGRVQIFEKIRSVEIDYITAEISKKKYEKKLYYYQDKLKQLNENALYFDEVENFDDQLRIMIINEEYRKLRKYLLEKKYAITINSQYKISQIEKEETDLYI